MTHIKNYLLMPYSGLLPNHKIIMKYIKSLITILLIALSTSIFAQPVIYINQVGFDSRGPKIAVIGSDTPLSSGITFSIVNVDSHQVEFKGVLGAAQKVADWFPNKVFYQADFSKLAKPGNYKLEFNDGKELFSSEKFTIAEGAL